MQSRCVTPADLPGRFDQKPSGNVDASPLWERFCTGQVAFAQNNIQDPFEL